MVPPHFRGRNEIPMSDPQRPGSNPPPVREFDDLPRPSAAMPGEVIKLKQPRGLYTLFMTEMWERFSFYGMKALLVLYLIKPPSDGGLDWSKNDAGKLMGWYSGLVYLTPIIGGYLADRLLGTHRSLIIGGAIIALGHFTLMTGDKTALFAGLGLVIVGTGFFKSNVSTMVGQLYQQGDARRDAGFTIFYMGINLGAFIAPIVCGILRVKYGWAYGFGAAGVGMTLGLIQYMIAKPRHLKGIGDAPTRGNLSAEELEAKKRPLTREETHRVAVIFIMAFFVFFFWSAFEQAGNSMSAFAEEQTDRSTPHWLESFVPDEKQAADATPPPAPDPSQPVKAPEPKYGAANTPPAKDGFKAYPAEWFQSVNAGMILILAPIFAQLWVRLARWRKEPSTLMKMAMGLVILGGGFIFMVMGGKISDTGVRVSAMWLITAFFIHTVAELCLSPVGLSLVTKLAPWKFASLLMGVWFLANFFANLTAGLSLGISNDFSKGQGPFHIFGGQADFFLIWVIAPIAAGLILMSLVPTLRKWTHGRA
jgi:proton-dependent oligopeptide transporter, POT family